MGVRLLQALGRHLDTFQNLVSLHFLDKFPRILPFEGRNIAFELFQMGINGETNLFQKYGIAKVGVSKTQHQGHVSDAMYAPERFLRIGSHKILFCLDDSLLFEKHLQ